MNYDYSFDHLRYIRDELSDELSEMNEVRNTSTANWDSDTKQAYESVISEIYKEIESLIMEIRVLSSFIDTGRDG